MPKISLKMKIKIVDENNKSYIVFVSYLHKKIPNKVSIKNLRKMTDKEF